MPMVVKIVGSTPTARTINESEVVGVLDTEQNKQIYETGREVQTLRFAKELQSRSTVTGCSKGNITAEKCTYCRSRRNKAQSNRGASKGTYSLACLILDLVVQLVRISACHAEGREFESRLDRSYKLNTIIDG